MKRIYLDYASATPLDKKVFLAMKPFLKAGFRGAFYNPSALYAEGAKAKKAVDQARLSIARILGCQTQEVIFTGSGTESDNLAILGIFESVKKKILRPHIVTTAIEHPAVLEICKEVERRGGEVSYILPEENGIASEGKIISAVRENTILVSVMTANNEIGTLQPVGAIAREIKAWRKKNNSQFPFFHTDACQAANYIPVNVQSLGADLISLDGGKIYGPKGVGVLVARTAVALSPIIFGGGQEKGLRSGTENCAAIVGMAEALKIAVEKSADESARLTPLRDSLITAIRAAFTEALLNGDEKKRLPNSVSICFPKLNAEFAVIALSQAGVMCSAGSSCKSLSETDSSYVVEAIGRKNCSASSLRFTLGRGTTEREIKLAAEGIFRVISELLQV